jgi:hypothetical protein
MGIIGIPKAVTKDSPLSGSDIDFPPYPYVPGRCPRYSGYTFNEIKASVTPDIAPHDLGKTRAFLAGRAFYDAGYYWECYQVLDPVWMQTEDPSPERDVVLAFIQLANARLKLLSDRPRAAWRLCDMVQTHLSRCPADRPVLGLYAKELLKETQATRLLAKAAM